MIHKDEIESKDFCGAISRDVYKLKAISEALNNKGMEVDFYIQNAIEGFAYIIDEVVDDLETIYSTLYMSDEPKKKQPEAIESTETD